MNRLCMGMLCQNDAGAFIIENEPHTIRCKNTSLQPQKMITIILMLSLEF